MQYNWRMYMYILPRQEGHVSWNIEQKWSWQHSFKRTEYFCLILSSLKNIMNCNAAKFLYILCRIEQSLYEIINYFFSVFLFKTSWQKSTSDKMTNLKYFHAASHPFKAVLKSFCLPYSHTVRKRLIKTPWKVSMIRIKQFTVLKKLEHLPSFTSLEPEKCPFRRDVHLCDIRNYCLYVAVGRTMTTV